jgi:Ca-activated chloride channel homolog
VFDCSGSMGKKLEKSRQAVAEFLKTANPKTDIAEQTGGRQYAVENLAELPDITAKIGVELRNQYIVGYSPHNEERNGKYRRVEVRLNQPRELPFLRAFWRHGYYAPSE